MTRKYFLLFSAAFVFAFSLAGCNKPAEEPVDPADLEPFVCSVPVTENWIFESRPQFTIHVENPNNVEAEAAVTVSIVTDKKKAVTTVETSSKIPANASKDILVTTEEDLEPGFYKATCKVNDKNARKQFGFGVSPTKIVSAPDKQPDFDEFWETAKQQLAGVDMQAVLTELPSFSGSARKVYLVEMQSIPDGLEGEPVVIRGYFCEPQDGKAHPVIMHFQGYDDLKPSGKLWVPYGGSSADYSEFYLSHRGQYINNRKASQRTDGIDRDFENIYGDWFAFNFGNKDGYYYRGAYMDCVQAIRFMATRPSSDMNNVFAEGNSQGGALSYAAAALSDYPLRAIAPGVAFLGDFPDYFQIVSWPGDVAKSHKGSMTDDEMYAFLSYFDTKNLATRISCPVMADLGLQDSTCPPHTNMAPYNNLLSTDKEMHYYPEMGHEIASGWESMYTKFFKARIQ